MSDPQTLDFSQTQRVLLLIDLHHLPSPAALLSSAHSLLSFPPLSSSLFAIKFFLSSLSPLLSSSKLRPLLSPLSSPFDLAPQTLASLAQALNGYQDLTIASSSKRARFAASTVCEAMHEYIWEQRVEEDDVVLDKNSKNSSISVIKPNLVIVFSPISRDFRELKEFLDMDTEIGEGEEVECGAICERFGKLFNSAREGLGSRDVHCSWIDVNCGEEEVLGRVFEKGVRSLGWGFCSTDGVVLGSGVVPFGMIYPMIGCEMKGLSSKVDGRAELCLGIKDVGGKPLECSCCELELVGLRRMRRGRCGDISGIWDSGYSGASDCSQEEEFWGERCAKISVKEVWKDVNNLKLKDSFHDYVLLRGSSHEHRMDRKGSTSGDFYADKVLQTLCMDTSEFTPGKPLWPLFLNFLYRNNYWAVVSVSFGDEDSLFGILKPFTVHSAIVCMLDRSISCKNHDLEELSSSLVETVTANEVSVVKVDENQENPSSLSQPEGLKRRNHKKHSRFLQNLSWSSFREAVLNKTKMDLEDIYFGSESNNSKKMKFLRCWMKQTQKSSRCFHIRPTELKITTVVEEKPIETVDELEKENELPVSSSFSTEEPSSSEPSLMIGETVQISCSETLEGFFDSLSTKIQQGLEFKEVDLCALAERFVESSIYWLCLKREKETTPTDATHEDPIEDDVSTVATELVKLLLKEPKYLATKYKGCDPSSSASESCPVPNNSENKVREYELQILFRMEILRSKVQGIEEISTKKMVKQICLLLDDIQYHLDGGCFGDVSLEKYVERTIKTRYSHCLRDVVDKIYTKMDLLLCYDEEPPSSSQMNSEDGSEAPRQKTIDNEIGESASASASASTSSSTRFRSMENSSSPLESRSKDHQSSLSEAQERRERASRFLSFTRGVQHLQRVWAPKQPKATKVKSDSHRKHPKGKARRGARDVVCDTPESAKKRSCLRENYGNEEPASYNIKSSKSVSKALFQDDIDA